MREDKSAGEKRVLGDDSSPYSLRAVGTMTDRIVGGAKEGIIIK